MKYLYTEFEHFDYILDRWGMVSQIHEKKISIYGTGECGEKVYEYLVDRSLVNNLVSFVDRDDSPMIGKIKYGIIVEKLDKVVKETNVILVASEWHHKEIVSRINDLLCDDSILIMDMYEKIYDSKDYEEYVSYIDKIQYGEKKEYVGILQEGYKRTDIDTKVIAWYLPQYYVTDYNNRFHGMGFTEWTNSSKALPQFCGHYQPHIPYHMGYYDLSNYQSIKRQAEIAKFYGIYGFAIHYYWFNEKTQMLDTPIKLILEHKDIEINYFINWATEDWGMTWDDSFSNWDFAESHIKQDLPKDVSAFFDMIKPYFEDERYIRIHNMPVLSIYNCNIFDSTAFKIFIDKLKKEAIKRGYKGLYIIITTGSNYYDGDVNEWGGDALVEYQPNYMCQFNYFDKLYPKGYINPHFRGTILDTREFFAEKRYFVKHISKKFFRGACTSWDNTARKGKTGARIIWGITPDILKVWLVDIMVESKKIHTMEEDFIFISSWNEWAEGSHLEPDMRYGYAWLNAIRSALETVKEH
ncbi:Glycosyltransferase WbsX [Selenomonas ruminantium]|uniref:Glycosyltransferase WbsX n=1 Tax=Selenomonas ruminantium TaxID=971 RepID=A0A1M6UKK2_SELRU|nr:glycoside hydrolase family 99-like domain-containing protein [Selenomonas ruminantium]SHK69638.1 Glycosyltransferase WbsX [Selenomonas ruminantium]